MRRGGFRGSPPKKRKKSVDLGVYLGVYLGNSPPGIYKLFTTGKSHAPAHISEARGVQPQSPSSAFHSPMPISIGTAVSHR